MKLRLKHIVISIFIFILLFSSSFYIIHKFNINKDVQASHDNNEANPITAENVPPSIEADSVEVMKPVSKLQEIIISSVGDCTLGSDDKFYKPASLPGIVQSKNNDYGYLFKNVSDIFIADDITTVNLETTLTNSESKREDRQFNFKGSPEMVKALIAGNIEAVNLSNNHIYDYNQQGFNDTIKTLKDNNVNYFGEGNRWITSVKGIKFAFLGYTGWSNDSKFLQTMKKDIQNLKTEGCIVIVNFHWGEESQYVPNNIQKSIAHSAIDSGADLVIGHHPHVIQGIEKYKDKFICYSLANFCFGGNSNPPDKDTFILQAKFIFNGDNFSSMGIRVIPCSVSSVPEKNDYCPTPLKGAAKATFFDKLNKLSASLGFSATEVFSNEILK